MEESLIIFVLSVELGPVLHENVDNMFVSLLRTNHKRSQTVNVTQLRVSSSEITFYIFVDDFCPCLPFNQHLNYL